jgi:hypothetical protein
MIQQRFRQPRTPLQDVEKLGYHWSDKIGMSRTSDHPSTLNIEIRVEYLSSVRLADVHCRHKVRLHVVILSTLCR